MTYEEAMAYLQRPVSRGMVLGLETMRELMALLGNPQDRLKLIHVAGTNGKGSVCAFLRSVLTQAGYRTGAFLSPAIFDFREQIQVDGQWIPQAAITRQTERIAAAVSRMEERGHAVPTVYEMTAAMAFLCFVDYACEYVVLETGLGGDLDATNIVTTTICSVITSISRDHTRLLGDTPMEIARHKAGIIKPGVPVVACKNADAGANAEIAARARALDSPLTFVDPAEVSVRRTGADSRIVRCREHDYTIRLLGTFQEINSAVACTVVEVLRTRGVEIPEQAFQLGMAAARWPGRLECLSKNPLILADGAHNPAAAVRLRESLEKDFTNISFLCIIGILRDKEYRSVLETMLPLAKKVYAVTPDNPRALPAEELAQTVRGLADERALCVPAEAVPSVAEALARAQQDVREADCPEQTGILAFGSLYYIGDLIRLVREAGVEE